MKKKFTRFVCSLLVMPLFVLALASCEGEEQVIETPFGPIFIQGVDLAVSDTELSQVNLYFDVLNAPDPMADPAGAPDPDVILDSAGSGIGQARNLLFVNGHLVVCDGSNGNWGNGPTGMAPSNTVRIFHNYLSLSDGDAPDTIFAGGFDQSAGADGISQPFRCVYDAEEDVLAIADPGDDEVNLVYNFTGVGTGTDPAGMTIVTLDMATSLIDDPHDLAVTGDDLWVVNNDNSGAGEPCVTGYRGIAGLVDSAPPDVELDADVSFFGDGLDTDCNGHGINTYTNQNTGVDELYVTTYNHELFIFRDQANLADNAIPDAVLVGGPSIDAPQRPLVAGDTLWISMMNWDSGVCTGAPGVVGYSQVGSQFDFQLPNIILDPANPSSVGQAQSLQTVAGALFFTARPGNCNWTASGVHVYRNASAIQSGQKPDFHIPAADIDLPSDALFLENAAAIAVTQRNLTTP